MSGDEKSDMKRIPGRPAGMDPAQLREKILDSAISVWVKQGISASSLRDVAKFAQVSPALINYHFGDKEGLIDAFVLQRLLPELERMHLQLTAVSDGSVLELARAFLTAKFELAERLPYLPQLWIREVVSESGLLRERVVRRLGPLIPMKMAERFALAKAQLRLSTGVDPALLVVSLIGLSFFAMAAKPVWQNFFPAQTANASQRLLDHAMALLTHGIETKHE